MREQHDHDDGLRRVDLRFAAGIPWPNRVAIEVRDESLASGLQAISRAAVPLVDADVETCDLVVLDTLRDASLGAAASVLRVGGGCWVEARLWPLRGANTLTRRIGRHGFTAVEPLVPWPSPRRARQWLALDTARRSTLAWQAPRPGGQNPIKLLLRVLHAAIWRVRLAGRLGMPVAVVARRQGRPADDRRWPGRRAVHNIRAVVHETVRSACDAQADGGTPTHLAWSLATGGQHSSNKVLAMFAERPSAPPRVVVKFPRVESSSAALEREARMLTLLERRRVAGVPRLIGLHRFRAGVAVVESALTGRPMHAFVRDDAHETLALISRRWLIGLASPDRSASTQVRAVRDAFTRLAREFVDPGTLWRGLAQLDLLEALPAVVEHRDFAPWNLLIDARGSLEALDWESAVPDGVPGADFAYLLTYLGFSLLGARHRLDRQAEVYSRIWDTRTPLGRRTSTELVRYLDELGLDAALARPIRLYTWALHAVSEQHRAGARLEGGRRRPGIFMRLWTIETETGGDAEDAASPVSPVPAGHAG